MIVCVFTGTRAEYGLLKRLIRLLDETSDITMQLLVSGTHLSTSHGMTVNEIIDDGFTIDERVPIPTGSMEGVSTAHAVGAGVGLFAEALERLKPDMLIVLGDRYEAFAVASAALFMRVPIAHIHGGEVTEGAFDEAIRHSISKMSHIHFPSTETYRDRLIQLGENPDSIFQVGSLGVEAAFELSLLTRQELEESLHVDLGSPFALTTFHPATLDAQSPLEQFESMLNALLLDSELMVLLTGANADPGGDAVNRMAAEYMKSYPERLRCFPSLGQLRYLSAMQLCTVVVGNSSSGIIEAPSFGVPTVNIGNRQKGRVRAESVIDCGTGQEDISAAIEHALSDDFRSVAKTVTNPYHSVGTAASIVDHIRIHGQGLSLSKSFYDLPSRQP